MNTKLLEATDVASGTFSLLLLLTLAATVLLFMGTGWVTRKWKLPLTMAGLVMGVSALHYFQAGQVWQASGQMPAIYRYILWFVSMPLQVMVMYFFVNTMSPLSTWLFWRLLVASVAMVTARYLGETNLMYPSLGFLIGLACWLYVLGEVFFGRMSEVSAKSSNFSVHRLFLDAADCVHRLGLVPADLFHRRICWWRERCQAQYRLQPGRCGEHGGI